MMHIAEYIKQVYKDAITTKDEFVLNFIHSTSLYNSPYTMSEYIDYNLYIMHIWDTKIGTSLSWVIYPPSGFDNTEYHAGYIMKKYGKG